MCEKSNEILKKTEIKAIVEREFFDYMQDQKENKLKSYKILNKFVKKGQSLFVASSLMEWFPINKNAAGFRKRYTYMTYKYYFIVILL